MQDPNASTPSHTSKLFLRNAFTMTETSLLAQISSSVGEKNKLGNQMPQISDFLCFRKLEGKNSALTSPDEVVAAWLANPGG